MKRKTVLSLGVGVVAVALWVLGHIDGPERDKGSVGAESPGAADPRRDHHEPSGDAAPKESPWEAALRESDPERRRWLLARWADTIEVSKIEDFLAHLGWKVSSEQCPEMRQALLSSWLRRDRSGMATWFGRRRAADVLHQESRDLLANELAGMEPIAALAWMEQSMPEGTRREFYSSFFQQWVARDPVAAVAELRRLADAAGGEPIFWSHLFGDVAAQWAKADLPGAVAWTKSLPEGAVRSQAMVQVGYRWATSDPQRAAEFAAEQNNVELFEAVASTWAANDPKHAAEWACGLPASEGQSAALATVSAVWAQGDPVAAAACASTLPVGEARNQALAAVAAVWSEADPAQAAKCAEEIAEGPARERAFERLVHSWAVTSAGEAGEWLKRLPASPSRDIAVTAFCGVIDGADPAASFAWAQTISDEDARNQKAERTATIWLAKDPEMARPTIARSSLPDRIKKQFAGGLSR
jgi:hypothetical protein